MLSTVVPYLKTLVLRSTLYIRGLGSDQFRYLHTSNSAGQRWAALLSAAQRCPAALPSAGQRWAALVAAIAILKQRCLGPFLPLGSANSGRPLPSAAQSWAALGSAAQRCPAQALPSAEQCQYQALPRNAQRC